MKETTRFQARDIALLGILAALTATLTIAEGWLPPLPIAGARLGLANVAITVGMWIAGPIGGVALGVFKVLVTFLTRGTIASIMALGGTVLSMCMTAVCLPMVRKERWTFVGVSVAAAGAHTLGQLLTASLIMSASVMSYAPVLFVVAIISGAVTGELLNGIVSRLPPVRQNKYTEDTFDKERM